MPVPASSTSQRLLALLSLLQARRDWPARVLAERLDVSERTVRRDVERLRELDYAIDATRGPDGGYRLGSGAHLPPLLLDDEQAVALAISLRAAGSLGAGIDDAAERALATLSRTMPAHLVRRIDRLVPAAAPPARSASARAIDPRVLERIGDAVARSEELRFGYAPAGASPAASGATASAAATEPAAPLRIEPLRIEPHHVVLHGGRWYLIGYSADRAGWRVYRIDRMALRSHTGRRFTPRALPGGDPAAFLSARFKGSRGPDTWPCWGEAVLAMPASEAAPYVGDGTVEALDASHCRVRLGSWSWNALAAELGRFDADLAEARPPELGEAVARLARRFGADRAEGAAGPLA